jgi:hypothetical protein
MPELATIKPSATVSTLEKKDVFASAYDDIQAILDGSFSPEDKAADVANELKRALVLPTSLVDWPEGVDFKAKLETAKNIIVSSKVSGMSNELIKNIVIHQLQYLRKDPLAEKYLWPVVDTANWEATSLQTEWGKSETMSVTVWPDGKGAIVDTAADPKVETPQEVIARMAKENQELAAELTKVKWQMKQYGPWLIRLSLAMHPGQIPRYLKEKFRNRGVAKLSGNVYAQLYHLRDGRYRRFVSQKKREAGAPALCDALIRKNEAIVNDPSAIPAQTIIAERRLALLKQIKEMISHIKPIDAKTILAGK